MKKIEEPAWISALVESVISVGGNITARVLNMTPVWGSRPKKVGDVDSDPAVLDSIRARKPGMYVTLTYIGGATVVLAPFGAFQLFGALERSRSLSNFAVKYGELGDDVLLGFVRNTLAPGIWNCAEPCGGMAQSYDLLDEQTREIVESGIFNGGGWVGFCATSLSDELQQALVGEQRRWWKVVKPRFHHSHDVVLEHLTIGEDSLDGRKGVISVGKIGDYQLTSFAKLRLEPGRGYRLQDLECHFDGKKWLPLNRTPVMIADRMAQSPLMLLGNSADGLLHTSAPHVPISGEAVDVVISLLMKGVLGPRGLNWLKE